MDLRASGPKNNRNKKGAALAKKEQRREDAATRQAAHDKLTLEEKMAKLDAGGFRASKERAELIIKMTAEKIKENK